MLKLKNFFKETFVSGINYMGLVVSKTDNKFDAEIIIDLINNYDDETAMLLKYMEVEKIENCFLWEVAKVATWFDHGLKNIFFRRKISKNFKMQEKFQANLIREIAKKDFPNENFLISEETDTPCKYYKSTKITRLELITIYSEI